MIRKNDVLFLGFPIWRGGLPKIIYTFLESYTLDGKVIVPFCTSGGSGMDESIHEIRALVPNADVKDGRRFSGSETNNREKPAWRICSQICGTERRYAFGAGLVERG